ncbi:MAG: hypothetical protein ACI814_004786, partial [Mariniblastus sp.]
MTNTSTKRKRVNKLRHIPPLALRANQDAKMASTRRRTRANENRTTERKKEREMRNTITLLPVLFGAVLAFALVESETNALAIPQDARARSNTDDANPPPLANRTEKELHTFLTVHCSDCHNQDDQAGDTRLDNFAELGSQAKEEILNRIEEQVYLGQMPPDDGDQPTDGERELFFDLVKGQFQAIGVESKFRDKLRTPAFGNYVNHDKLFSGDYKDLKAFTYDRRWLISEFIFDAKFNRILNHNPSLAIDGKRESLIGSNNRRVNLTNPFLLPSNTGVRYYDNTTLNGGHLLTMITNAKEAANYMTTHLAKRDRNYIPALTAIMDQENKHNATLASRESFLNNYIDQLLMEIYAGKNNALLPKFVRVEIEEPKTTDASGKPIKKAAYHAANPGKEELRIIYRDIKKHQTEGDTDEQIIEKCENDWFNFGVNERKIRARVVFMHGYITEIYGQMNAGYNKNARLAPYKKLNDDEMEVITAALLKHRKTGEPFNVLIDKCMAEWEAGFLQTRIQAGPPKAEIVNALVDQLFHKILERSPTMEEAINYHSLTTSYIKRLGNLKAIEKLVQTILLRSDFVYRNESGQGDADAHGRKRLSARDASYAIAYALTDNSPDAALVRAVKEFRLQTKEDYRREILRLLANRDQYYVIDESVNKQNDITNVTNMPIRELRFFREFFGYQKLLTIFKDNKRFGANYDAAKQRLVTEADRLIEHIVEQDKDVFNELLTTDKFYVYHSGDNEAMQASADRIRKIYDYFKDKDWQDYTVDDLAQHKVFIAEVKMRGIDVNRLVPGGRYNPVGSFKTQMTSFTLRLDKGQTAAAPYNAFPAHGMANASSRFGGRLQSPEVAKFFNVDMAHWNFPSIQPAALPHRKGMLTHPAWLIAHAQNTETDPIHRGKWVQEKLLAGTIPDVPITVDANVPEDPHKTLRQRLDAKTNVEYCWTCHQKMNPLGLPFEMFDDFGRFRTQERLEYPEHLIEKSKDKGSPHEDLRDIYKTLPVDARGHLEGTGDSKLDGEVTDALDLIDRLAKSERVRQSIIRYAFRYFMGRNELLSDSQTLI